MCCVRVSLIPTSPLSAILVLAIEVTGAVTDAGREGQIVVGAVTGVVVVRRVVAIVVT